MAYRILATAALCVALAVPALADEIRPSGAPIVIKSVGAGTLIQAPSPVGGVFIADTGIADVQVPTQGGRNLIYVYAKAVGKTSLYALGDDGQVVLSHVVEVSGPKTVRVLRGNKTEIWSEAHGKPTEAPGSSASASASAAAEIPANTTHFIAVGSMPTTK